MKNNNQLAIIAIVSALALFGVVMVTVAVTMQLQEADAAQGCNPAGRPTSTPAINASKGRCFNPN
jgi:hypothetical protein